MRAPYSFSNFQPSVALYLLDTIPITSSINREHLTYFTSTKALPGAIVNVPIRKKIVPAVVVSVESIASAKVSVKRSEFAIKKIDSFAQKEFFLPQFIDTCKEAAEYFLGSTGAVLFQATPKKILDSISSITPLSSSKTKRPSRKKATQNERLVLEENSGARLLHFKNLIREAFARNESIFILTATVREAEYISVHLSKGIEKYVTVLHGDLPKKKMIGRFNAAAIESHPVCIIATGMFLSLPRLDMGTIIIERESAHSYKLRSRPFLDMRVFASMYAARLNIRLILADMPLSVEVNYRNQKGEFDELIPKKARISSEAKQIIIDIRTGDTDKITNTKRTYSVVSPELRKFIKNIGQHDRPSQC